jgi:hypothetical protein
VGFSGSFGGRPLVRAKTLLRGFQLNFQMKLLQLSFLVNFELRFELKIFA